MLTKEQLQERALLVRVHEANCAILFPSPLEQNFRVAIMKKLASACDLKELRTATIAGAGGCGRAERGA
jgi:hypothetical protein